MAVQNIYDAIIHLKMPDVPQLVRAEIDAGTGIFSILNDGLIAPMDEVGRRFSAGDLFIPEMLMAAKAMKEGLEVLKPHMTQSGTKDKGTVIIGTVRGDLHDIGKNLVIMMLEGGGFRVVNLGVDVDIRKFKDTIEAHDAKIVALSALLTTTMPAMEKTVAALKKDDPTLKIMIGGAPVTQSFADKIGADGYGDDAPSAVRLARGFIGEL